MKNPNTNLRTKQKNATRIKLMNSALVLFATKGYDKVSLNEVADHAQLHIQTLFRHFPNKLSLACAYFDKRADQLIHQLEQTPSHKDVYRVWRKSTLAGLRIVTSRDNALELFQMVHQNEVLVAHNVFYGLRTEAALAAALQNQDNRRHIQPLESTILAAALTSAYRAAHFKWIHSDGKVNSVETLQASLCIIEEKFSL